MPTTILVVDDDPSVRRLICDVLEHEGYAVRLAEDGYAALRLVRSARPDAIVLDVMMPGLDGHDVLSRLREADGGPGLPIVMLTAAAGDQHAWRAWGEGVDYFLAKPFDAGALLGYLDQLFGARAGG